MADQGKDYSVLKNLYTELLRTDAGVGHAEAHRLLDAAMEGTVENRTNLWNPALRETYGKACTLPKEAHLSALVLAAGERSIDLQEIAEVYGLTTKAWFEVTDPQPTQFRLNAQFGNHLEEVREMFPEITSGNPEVDAKMQLIDTLLSEVASLFKSQQVNLKVLNNKKFFDSLLDQRVTLTGVAHLKGYAFDEGVARVDVANFTKFVDGVPQYKEGGKVAKGPYFVEPNIPYPAED